MIQYSNKICKTCYEPTKINYRNWKLKGYTRYNNPMEIRTLDKQEERLNAGSKSHIET